MRSRPAPYGGLTQPTIRFKILNFLDISKVLHVSHVSHGLVKIFLDNLFACGVMFKTKKSSPCRNNETPDSVERYRQGVEDSSQEALSLSLFLHTRIIEALCCILRAVHCLVQNCVPTIAITVFAWHLDHDGATRFAVERRSTDVVEPHDSHISRLSTGPCHVPTEHESEALKWWSCRKRAARVASCVHSLARLVSCTTILDRTSGRAASPPSVYDPSFADVPDSPESFR